MTAMARKVLLTGGNGFIGTAVAQICLDAGFDVHTLDRTNPSRENRRVTRWQGSFDDPSLLSRALERVDTVIHLAASYFAREANQNPLRDCHENICGSLQLLDKAAKAGVRRFIYASSGGTIYGPTDEVPIAEKHPTNPVTAYGISKLACEKYLRLYDGQGRISTLTLRISNPYGLGQNISNGQGALTAFCKKAVTGEPIEIWGDGTVQRDFVAIQDVSRAFLLSIDAPAHGTEINIGSGFGTSLNTIINTIAEIRGTSPVVHYAPGRQFDVPKNYLDITRAQTLLSWSPKVGLVEGISNLLDDMERPSAQLRTQRTFKTRSHVALIPDKFVPTKVFQADLPPLKYRSEGGIA